MAGHRVKPYEKVWLRAVLFAYMRVWMQSSAVWSESIYPSRSPAHKHACVQPAERNTGLLNSHSHIRGVQPDLNTFMYLAQTHYARGHSKES